MKRRQIMFSAGLTGLGALLGAGLARSQSSAAVRKVAVLEASVGRRDTLRRALAALGWHEGVNLNLQFVSALGQQDRIEALAAAMVAGEPAHKNRLYNRACQREARRHGADVERGHECGATQLLAWHA